MLMFLGQEWPVAYYAVQEESSAWSHLMKISIRRIAPNDLVSKRFFRRNKVRALGREEVEVPYEFFIRAQYSTGREVGVNDVR
jgi:hypothetical protein